MSTEATPQGQQSRDSEVLPHGQSTHNAQILLPNVCDVYTDHPHRVASRWRVYFGASFGGLQEQAAAPV